MKPSEFLVTLALASICLVLSIAVIWQGQSSISLNASVQSRIAEIQSQAQQRQLEINRGAQSQQIGTNILRDIAAATYNANGSVKNEKLKDLLTRNGISVTVNQNPQNPSTSQPTPAK